MVLSGVQAQEGALGVFTAECLAAAHAPGLARVAGAIDQRAAQIAGRWDAQACDAGGQIGSAQVLRDQGAADGQAVVVVIGAVAQRHAVQRIAQVGGVEAAHLQRQGLFVDAQGVDRLGADARQEVQRLLDAGSRRQGFEIGGQQGRDRACLALADHDDFADLIRRLVCASFTAATVAAVDRSAADAVPASAAKAVPASRQARREYPVCDNMTRFPFSRSASRAR